ncbi:unnamed protein product [Musa acuminata var. zebrina]
MILCQLYYASPSLSLSLSLSRCLLCCIPCCLVTGGGHGLDSGNLDRLRRTGGLAEGLRGGGPDADVLVVRCLRLLMGAAELDHPHGGLARGDPVGGTEHRRGRQPLCHLRPETVLPRHAVPLQARHLRLLLCLGRHHDGLHRRLPVRDQRGSPGVDRRPLALPLVLAAVPRRREQARYEATSTMSSMLCRSLWESRITFPPNRQTKACTVGEILGRKEIRREVK